MSLLALLAAAAVGAWFLTRTPAQAPPGAASTAAPPTGPAIPPTQGAPPSPAQSPDSPAPGAPSVDLGPRPDSVGEAVRTAAKALPRDPAALLDAVRKAPGIRLRPADAEPRGAPLSAESLAPSLTAASPTLTVGSLEICGLLAALLEAQGQGPVTYAVDDGEPRAATDLSRRRFAVRAAQGGWLAPVGAATLAAPRLLTDAEVAANFVALGSRSAHAQADLDGASKLAHQAARAAPNDAAILFSLGLIQLDGGLDEIGLETLERAARLRSDAATWYALGLANMQAQQHFRSHEHLAKAASEDATYAEPLVMLAQLALQRLETTPKSEQGPVVTEVAAQLDAAAARDPNVAGIRTLRAQLAALDGKLEESERLMREEVKLHPDEDGAWFSLVQLLLQTDRTPEAREALEQAARRETRGPELLVMLAEMLIAERLLSDALPHLEHALALVPGSEELRPKLAQIHHALGRSDQARQLLEEHLARFDKSEARLLLAQLEIDNARFEAAEAALAKVAERGDAPEEVALLRYIAALRSGKGKPEAKSNALKLLGKRSELAQILLGQAVWDEAEALLREALREDIQDEQAPLMLFAVLLAQGKPDDAEKLSKDVLATTPEDKRAEVQRRFETAREEAKALLKSREAEPTP